MTPSKALKSRARRIVRKLDALYPDAECALTFEGPLQLLVATILSAQCTDVRVNKVTPALFAKYPDAEAFAKAKQRDVEKLIHSTGFHRNKAKNIIACCKQIVAEHDGEVPSTMAELVQLAGIGRKTANVILGNAFETPGIPVDTHVGRLSRRMGLSEESNPVKVERDLMALIPEKVWTLFGHQMIYHGRAVCQSRKPRCEDCKLSDLCPKNGVPSTERDKEPST